MSNQDVREHLMPDPHEATAQRRRSRTRPGSVKRRNVVFRAMDGRPLHVAKGDDRYVIACGEEYTYVVVYRGRGHWNVELVEEGGLGGVYLGEYPTWAAAKEAAVRVVEWKGLIEESLMGPWYSKEPTTSQLRMLLYWHLELESRLGYCTRGHVADDIALITWPLVGQ